MDYTSFAPGSSTQQNTPVSSPFVPGPSKHFLNKKFAITFGILILLGSGAYAGIWYWGKQQLAQEAVPTFAPRADETADWKTYTNAQYGFTFNYPRRLNEKPLVEDWLAVFSDEEKSTFGLKIVSGTLSKNKVVSIYGPVPVDKIYQKQIAGQTSYFFVEGDAGCGGHKYFVPLKSNYLIMQFSDCEGEGRASALSLEEDQILSTFKFTDSVDTSTWKTYISKQEPKLSFKYPADWTLESMGNSTQESVQLKAPKVGQYWTIINWSALVDGLGGGCPPERPHIIINKVESMPHADDLYFVSFGPTGSANGDYIGVVGRDNNGNPPKIGDTGSCLYYPLFKSKLDSSRRMWLTSGSIQAQDTETAKQIIESLTY